MQHPFLEAIERGIVLADGGTGTELRARGWNSRSDVAVLERPDLVRQLHEDYIAAGADVLLTNTFTANRSLMSRDGLAAKLRDANFTAARTARDAREIQGASVFVAGSLGPIGRELALGQWTLEDAYEAFEEQIGALVEGGVDLLWIETMPNLEEALTALRAARAVTADLPVVTMLDFNAGLVSPGGDSAPEIARAMGEAGADVVGVNCGVGPQAALDMLGEMTVDPGPGRYSVKPNAGVPRLVQGRPVYPSTPEYFANFALRAKDLGASLIGGCCGTTPDHVRAMRAALAASAEAPTASPAVTPHADVRVRMPVVEFTDTRGGVSAAREADEPGGNEEGEQRERLRDKIAAGRFAISIEIDPPRGANPRKAIEGAAMLREAGADAINIGDSPMARVRMSALALAVQIEQRAGIETLIHQTTRDRNLMALQADMLGAHSLGIRNVIALTGDPPPEASPSSTVWDADSVGFIRVLKQLNEGVDFFGNSIGRKTEFYVAGAANPTADDLDLELRRVRKKIDAGADLLMTQPVYEEATVREFFERLGPIDVPVLIGVMPLVSSRHAEFIHNELAGVVVPQGVRDRMRAAGEEGAEAGLAVSMEHVAETRDLEFVSGIYIMPSFGRYEVAAEMVRQIVGD
jgi:homocysteine S-methyltransferase